MFFLQTTYDIRKIKSSSFLAYTHLGLGDHIICNGLLNYLSKNYDSIYLPVKSRDIKNLEYLYKKNKKIKIFEIQDTKEVEDIRKFAKEKKIKILKVGFKKRKAPFNLSFYNQLSLPYDISIEYFQSPRDEEKEEKLFKHLKKYYKVEDEFQLVHNQSSFGKIELNLSNELPVIYVNKETDIFKNLFLYRKVIEHSSEIHCLDSSFLHLVERTKTNGSLFFHKIRKGEKGKQKSAKVHLIKNWKEINYIN